MKGARNLQRPARKRGGEAAKRGLSMEQVCILVARDWGGKNVDCFTGRGPVTVAQLKEHLRPVLAPDILLLIDANKAYQSFARQQRISHQYVNVSAGR